MPVARSSKHKVLSCQALPPFHPISLLPSRLLILCACAIPNTFPAKSPKKRHQSGLYPVYSGCVTGVTQIVSNCKSASSRSTETGRMPHAAQVAKSGMHRMQLAKGYEDATVILDMHDLPHMRQVACIRTCSAWVAKLCRARKVSRSDVSC